MVASAIRELAASKNSTSIAAGLFEKTIQVWDVKSQKMVCEFAAVFRMGARNLALAPDGGMLVAGLSGRRGVVTAYQIPSGKKVWERKRLIYPSKLRFDSTGQSIVCTVNDCASLLHLDVGSGTTIEEVNGISQHIEGPYGGTLTVPSEKSRKPYRLTAGNRTFDVGAVGFALLYATFSPQSVCLTEAGGPVRCINCEDGKLQWMFDQGVNSRVVRHYSPKLNAFFGVLSNRNNEHNRWLLRLDVTNGVCEEVCELDSDAWELDFLDVTDQVVTTSGEIRNLSDGALVGRLSFPQKEYHPDE